MQDAPRACRASGWAGGPASCIRVGGRKGESCIRSGGWVGSGLQHAYPEIRNLRLVRGGGDGASQNLAGAARIDDLVHP